MAEELVYELGRARQAQDWNRAAVVGEQLATGWPQDPRVGAWWYDAALARKFLLDWPEAYRLGRHAAAHASPGGQDHAGLGDRPCRVGRRCRRPRTCTVNGRPSRVDERDGAVGNSDGLRYRATCTSGISGRYATRPSRARTVSAEDIDTIKFLKDHFLWRRQMVISVNKSY